MKRTTTSQFIAKAKSIHGDKYDYSKVKYEKSSIKVCITCPKHGEFWQTPNSHLRGNGCLKCSMYSLVSGVGINDIEINTKDKCYKVWHSMMNRCYSKKYHSKFPTYQNCSVCNEWTYLSNFKRWFDENYVDGYVLDKDILVKGNKVYSPETCCFVPEEINLLLLNNKKKRGNLPIGVTFRDNSYYAIMTKHNKTKHIGIFKTPIEAFNAYKIEKEKYVKELADKYFKEGKINIEVYNALMKYKVEYAD